jgi:formylglycine-generating enzyme required for sulfatase activity
MVFVEGDTFTMGCTDEQGSDCWSNESPSYQVTLSSFSIGKYPVTQAQWVAVMGSNPSHFTGNLSLPIESVSWNDVQTFVSTLNSRTGRQYRLPTEAEWEYAARGGRHSGGFKYAGSNNIGDVAWYGANSSQTRPVGTKAPNELGIYDMSGNVWEWVNDWYWAYTAPAKTNPTGPATGSNRVIRGGSWADDARGCRVSIRDYIAPDFRHFNFGFRLVLSP